jgi:hypothetical protein
MNILIPSEFPEDFVAKIIDKFSRDIKLRLLDTDFRLLNLWIPVEFGFDFKVSCKEIIELALKNLQIVVSSAQYKVQINPTVYYPGTTTRLITLLKMINYGNRYFKGIPLITDECKLLNNELDSLYDQYRFIGMVF